MKAKNFVTKSLINAISKTKKSDDVDLTSARTVIGGGISLGSSKNFQIIKELAKLFKKSTIGATRAAVDAGYVPVDL